MKKINKAEFKKVLRSFGAYWITSEEEVIVGLLKGHNSDSILFTYGIPKGFCIIKDGGKYDNFHFTKKGLELIEEIKKTTCAFSGRSIRK